MSESTFDTLTYAKKLRAAGFTEAQAEAQPEALWAVVDHNLATKRDIADLRRELSDRDERLRHDLADIEARLRHGMADIEARTQISLRELDTRLTLRMGGLGVAAITIVAILVRPL